MWISEKKYLQPEETVRISEIKIQNMEKEIKTLRDHKLLPYDIVDLK